MSKRYYGKRRKNDFSYGVLVVIFGMILMRFFAISIFIALIYFSFKVAKHFGIFKKIRKSFQIYMKGKIGEKRVREELNTLGEEYIVLNDLNLQIGGHESQIDHLVIGRNCVFNIETKNYSGYIKVDDDNKVFQEVAFRLQNVSNIVSQSEIHEKTLKRILGRSIRINSIVVIANNDTGVSGGINSSTPIINICRLNNYIKSFNTKSNTINQQEIKNTILNHQQGFIRVCLKKLNYFIKDNKAATAFAITSLIIFMTIIPNVPSNLFEEANYDGVNVYHDEEKQNEILLDNNIKLDTINCNVIITKMKFSELGLSLFVLVEEKDKDLNLSLEIIDDAKDVHNSFIETRSEDCEEGYYLKIFNFIGVTSIKDTYKLKVKYNEYFSNEEEWVIQLVSSK